MNSYRKTAIIVGVLFIFAIVMLFVGEALYKPILDSPDYLDNAYPNKIVVITGILIEFTGVPAVVLLSLFLFPVLKDTMKPWPWGMLFSDCSRLRS